VISLLRSGSVGKAAITTEQIIWTGRDASVLKVNIMVKLANGLHPFVVTMVLTQVMTKIPVNVI